MPIAIFIVGVFRGAELGIPYLSPLREVLHVSKIHSDRNPLGNRHLSLT